MGDELYRVEIKGWVIRKDYMDEPEGWDWTEAMEHFKDNPNITITKVDTIESNKR